MAARCWAGERLLRAILHWTAGTPGQTSAAEIKICSHSRLSPYRVIQSQL